MHQSLGRGGRLGLVGFGWGGHWVRASTIPSHPTLRGNGFDDGSNTVGGDRPIEPLNDDDPYTVTPKIALFRKITIIADEHVVAFLFGQA